MPLSDPAHSKVAYQTITRLGSHRIAKNLDYNTLSKQLYVVSSSGNVGDLMVYKEDHLTVIRENITGLEYVATDYMSGNVYYTQQGYSLSRLINLSIQLLLKLPEYTCVHLMHPTAEESSKDKLLIQMTTRRSNCIVVWRLTRPLV